VRPLSQKKKSHHKKWAGGVVQGIGPKFQTPVLQKKKKKKIIINSPFFHYEKNIVLL
jgi:hypothetical protein